MSARQSPVPEFVFSFAPIENETTGATSMTVAIESKVGGYSNGFLFLDEIEDVILLRKELDKFIAKYKIEEYEKTIEKK